MKKNPKTIRKDTATLDGIRKQRELLKAAIASLDVAENAVVGTAPVDTAAGAGRPRQCVPMNVRFTHEQKVILERLAAFEDRSQNQIVMRLLGPALLEAARKLEGDH